MTIRIALALLGIVAAAMAYPWQSSTDRWIVGIAAGVVVVVFAWWRGHFVTTMIGRRIAVWRRNHSKPKATPSDRVTVVLRVEDPTDVGLQLPVVAGYVERFGIRATVRVTSRDRGGARTTWISVTLDATTNLAALQARSPELPLADTAKPAARRLADHLRETGLDAVIVDGAESPIAGVGRETWGGVRDERGVVAAYGIPVDENLAQRLAEIWSQATETWTTLEFGGTAAHPTVAAACALRSAEPVRGVPVSGLMALRGVQRPVLTAMEPCAVDGLDVPKAPMTNLDRLDWPGGSTNDLSRT